MEEERTLAFYVCMGVGALCLAAGLWLLANPGVDVDRSSLGAFAAAVPSEVANLQKLTLGATLTVTGAIFVTSALRPLVR